MPPFPIVFTAHHHPVLYYDPERRKGTNCHRQLMCLHVRLMSLPSMCARMAGDGDSSVYSNIHNETKEEILSKLPQKLVSCLLPFQKDGVVFAIERNGRYEKMTMFLKVPVPNSIHITTFFIINRTRS